MDTPYLIPANSKRSALIFSIFRPVDLLIFSIGAIVSLMLLMLVTEQNLVWTIIKLAPAGICTFLVMPFPNYHNVLTLITEIYQFYNNRRIYLWRGWCLADATREETEPSKK